MSLGRVLPVGVSYVERLPLTLLEAFVITVVYYLIQAHGPDDDVRRSGVVRGAPMT